MSFLCSFNKMSVSIIESNTNSVQVQLLPSLDYWKNRLICRGCENPLVPPIFYCDNKSNSYFMGHPLCKNCSRCNVRGCCSKAGTTRSFILERVLNLASFTCQFNCRKGPFQPASYNMHLSTCHLRPLVCSICKLQIHFHNYLPHLQMDHGMLERKLDKETLILDLSYNRQPRIQFVRFNHETFLIRYENYKLWVEYLGVEENAEVDYRIRVSGVKYAIDVDMEVIGARNGEDLIFGQFEEYEKNRSSNTMIRNTKFSRNISQNRNIFVAPPPDEELFLLFLCDYDDNSSISSVEVEADADADADAYVDIDIDANQNYRKPSFSV